MDNKKIIKSMKTNQIVIRTMFGHEIRQEHLTGFLCVTDFMNIANAWRKENGIGDKETKPKDVKAFWDKTIQENEGELLGIIVNAMKKIANAKI